MKSNRVLTTMALVSVFLIAAAGCKMSGMAVTSRGQLLKINIIHPKDLPERGEDNIDIILGSRGVWFWLAILWVEGFWLSERSPVNLSLLALLWMVFAAFYAALGFTVIERLTVQLAGEVAVPLVAMQRRIDPR